MQERELRNKVGAQLKEARVKSGLTCDQLADMSGVSKSTISKIENGKWSVSVDMLEKLLPPLDVDLYIF